MVWEGEGGARVGGVPRVLSGGGGSGVAAPRQVRQMWRGGGEGCASVGVGMPWVIAEARPAPRGGLARQSGRLDRGVDLYLQVVRGGQTPPLGGAKRAPPFLGQVPPRVVVVVHAADAAGQGAGGALARLLRHANGWLGKAARRPGHVSRRGGAAGRRRRGGREGGGHPAGEREILSLVFIALCTSRRISRGPFARVVPADAPVRAATCPTTVRGLFVAVVFPGRPVRHQVQRDPASLVFWWRRL